MQYGYKIISTVLSFYWVLLFSLTGSKNIYYQSISIVNQNMTFIKRLCLKLLDYLLTLQ